MNQENMKMTEVGWIPKDWEVKTIGQLFFFKNGLNKGKEYFGHGIPIVNYMDVFKKNGLRTPDVKGRVDLTTKEIANFEIKKGDVFFTRTSETPEEVGLSAVLLEDIPDGVFSGFLLRARPTTNELDVNYCEFCFLTKEFRNAVISNSTYTTRALTNGKALSLLSLPIPPTSEQRRIAQVLSDTDSLIAFLSRTIKKKRLVKQGAMQQLLTGKTRLKGFDGEWVEMELGEFGNTIRGVGFTPEQSSSIKFANSIALFRSNNIQQQSIVLDDIIYVERDCVSERQIMSYGDILICTANGSRKLVGKSSMYRSSFQRTFGAFMCVFRCYDKCQSAFVSYLFQSDSYKKQLDEMLTGSAINNLNGSQIEALHFCIPESVEEQQAIANILTTMDDEIAALEAERDKYISIKQGMMQKLLTGEIRLPICQTTE